MTPQDISDLRAADRIRERFAAEGKTAVCYGMGNGLGGCQNRFPMWKKISWWHRRHWKQQNIWNELMEHRMRSGYPLVDELVYRYGLSVAKK